MKIRLIIQYYAVLFLGGTVLVTLQILGTILFLINAFKYNFLVTKNLLLYKDSKAKILKKNMNEKILLLNYHFYHITKINFYSIWLFLNKKIFNKLRIKFYPQKNILLKKYKNPKVSIIIPTYKDFYYTIKCLESISKAKTKTSYEIILIDDSPPDSKVRQLSKIKNINLIANDKNIGYLMSCNLGVSRSNAEFIYLLNNDTTVTDFWLDELVKTFSLFPNAGIVGSKLINEDLSIQEMGSYIFHDGNGYNFGRGYPNEALENFVREVTYCSAASILIKKDDFIKVNGFDHDYYPAYYEDVDLAFKIKELGKITYCNPRSEVIHIESVSMGKKDNQKKNNYMKKNRKVFLSKWKSKISKNFLNIYDLAKQTKTIVIFEDVRITPKEDAGSLSIFNFAKLFQSMGFKVIFMFKSGDILDDHCKLMMENGFQVIINSKINNISHLKKLFSDNFIKPTIFYIARPNLFDEISLKLKKYFKSVLFIYDTVDLHFLRIQRQLKIDNNFAISLNELKKIETIEINNIINSDLAIIRSEFESKFLEENYPIKKENMLNLSLLFDTPKTYQIFNETEGIVFVANFNHLPNIDAIDFFINDIYKHLSVRTKNVNFYIVGKKGKLLFKNKVSHLNSKFIFVDFIDDITQFLQGRRLNIAPLRFGAGIKGKIAQSFVCGLPTVSTDIGFEGMSLKVTKQMLANTAVDFARKIDEIYFSKLKWNKSQKDIINYSNKWTLMENYKLVHSAFSKKGVTLNKKHQAVKLL